MAITVDALNNDISITINDSSETVNIGVVNPPVTITTEFSALNVPVPGPQGEPGPPGPQGELADTVVQFEDLADVAITGDYSDLSGTPTIPTTPGQVGAASTAQGSLAETAVQPGDPLIIASPSGVEYQLTVDDSGTLTTILHTPPPDGVALTVEGTTFAPQVRLVAASAATVQWLDRMGNVLATGLAPTITLPSADPTEVYLQCSAPEDVRVLNLGFWHAQDIGLANLGSSYNRPTQPVTSVAGLRYLPGLRAFCAARTNASGQWAGYSGPLLTGHLDLSGLSALEYVECYRNDIESLDLSGSSAVVRLCVEGTDLTELNLNPVAASLYDLRAADMQRGALHFTALDAPLANLYHWCVRTQQVTGHPAIAQLPAIQQLWPWHCGLVMDELAVRSSRTLESVRLSHTFLTDGPVNQVRRLDLAGQTFAAFPGEPEQRIWAWGVGLEEVDFTGMTGKVDVIDLHDNALTETAVDHVLAVVDGWGTSGGTLALGGGTNAAPSQAGMVDVTALQSRGWTVTHADPGPEEPGPVGPSVPTGLVVSGENTDGFTLTWSASQPGDAAITGYEYRLSSGTPVEVGDTLTVTVAADEGTYSAQVRAYDSTGLRSGWSTAATATVPGSGGGDPPPSGLLWADEFDRGDVSGWASVGNGWLQPLGGADLAISSGSLVISGGSGYQRMLVLPDISLPEEGFEVELEMENTSQVGGWFGVLLACNAVGEDGSKCLFASSVTDPPRTDRSQTATGAQFSDMTIPASWTDPGVHTMRVRMVGTTLTLFLDGQEVGYRTSSNHVRSGNHVGICGQSNGRSWRALRIYSLPE